MGCEPKKDQSSLLGLRQKEIKPNTLTVQVQFTLPWATKAWKDRGLKPVEPCRRVKRQEKKTWQRPPHTGLPDREFLERLGLDSNITVSDLGVLKKLENPLVGFGRRTGHISILIMAYRSAWTIWVSVARGDRKPCSQGEAGLLNSVWHPGLISVSQAGGQWKVLTL